MCSCLSLIRHILLLVCAPFGSADLLAHDLSSTSNNLQSVFSHLYTERAESDVTLSRMAPKRCKTSLTSSAYQYPFCRRSSWTAYRKLEIAPCLRRVCLWLSSVCGEASDVASASLLYALGNLLLACALLLGPLPIDYFHRRQHQTCLNAAHILAKGC